MIYAVQHKYFRGYPVKPSIFQKQMQVAEAKIDGKGPAKVDNATEGFQMQA